MSKVETDFIKFIGSPEYARVMTILSSLKSSNDILREVYVLSGINKLRELSFYLVFMFRKLESGRINLDNFMENYFADRNFIESYLKTYFNLEPVPEEDAGEEEKEINIFEDAGEDKDAEKVYSLAEPNFKVEELDNELVSEEFKETKLLELYDISESKYMELIQNNGAGLQAAPEKIDETPGSENVFDLPGMSAGADTPVKTDEPEIIAVPDISKEKKTEQHDDVYTGQIQSEDAKPDEMGKHSEMASFFEAIESGEEEKAKTKENAAHEPEEELPFFDEETKKQETETPPEEPIIEIKSKIPESNYIRKQADSEEEKINKPVEEIPAMTESDKEVEKKLQEIEQETNTEIINSAFQKYEEELFEKNRTINGLFDDLLLILDSEEQDYEMKNAIADEIVSISENLKECSKKMSFEIITKVYSSFAFCLDKKFREISVTKENIDVFKNSITGIEKLVNGEELGGFEKTIKMLEELSNDLEDLLAKRVEFEKKKFDFGEEERKIIEEFTDSGEKEAYLALRDRIIDMEDVFESLVSMKEKVAPFEVLRRLSSAFAQFREIVNIARILEMHKMAQLAEASYIFVKFLQNYRMDPYQKEVSEVLKYIIYCCKLIYLDKPVKDLDTFISYLNDPVRIFHTNPKNNNE
ncbi:MAG: hypothetical protein PHN88_09470 [Ignavibacteria bacterium]|nr:hypothetical protein [Ignavibacteria bacterium]